MDYCFVSCWGPVGAGLKIGVGMAAAKFGGKALLKKGVSKLGTPWTSKTADLIRKPSKLKEFAITSGARARVIKADNLRYGKPTPPAFSKTSPNWGKLEMKGDVTFRPSDYLTHQGIMGYAAGKAAQSAATKRTIAGIAAGGAAAVAAGAGIGLAYKGKLKSTAKSIIDKLAGSRSPTGKKIFKRKRPSL